MSINTNSNSYQRILSIRREEQNNSDHASSTRRTIGYSFCQATNPQHRTTAIVLFYPLAATSLIVDVAAESGAYDNYRANVLCVDRPGVGNTAGLPETIGSMERIERHADDVLRVLDHHGIQSVYLLGTCLGHPYAIQVARHLLQQCRSDASSCRLKGITLVAPFVSPACPSSWRIARLGASVPSFILRAATSTFTSIGSASIPLFLTPKQLKKMISREEQEEFGWSSGEDDTDNGDSNCERAVQLALKMHKLSRDAQAIEARLGADSSWQQTCDAFANELRSNQCSFPINIHASREDKVAPLESVLWIADRCYGGRDVVHIDGRVHSHEVMTMFGGPPGHPIIMHEIARAWNLL